MEYILKISNLYLSFNPKNQRDDSFCIKISETGIQKEKITALVGSNGAGKTTLFNILSGLHKGAIGDIVFNGTQINGLASDRIAQLGIGRLFQGARVFEELNVLDNMLLGSVKLRSEIPYYNLIFPNKLNEIESNQKLKAEKILLELFGEMDNPFLNSLNKPAGTLSYGQQRLLALARLLMGDYSLYLLDEPTSGVNINFIDQIAGTIKKMNSQSHKTVLLIEHNMEFVRKNAEYCLFMDEGSIIKEGTPPEVLDDELVQQIYMGF